MSNLDPAAHRQFHIDGDAIPENPPAHQRDPHVTARAVHAAHICPPPPAATIDGRAVENVDLRCQNCGQGLRVSLVDTYNHDPIRFCPLCGTPTITRSKSEVIKSGHYYKVDAACFAGVNAELVALLYQNWSYNDKRDDPDVELPSRFVDYLKEQLNG